MLTRAGAAQPETSEPIVAEDVWRAAPASCLAALRALWPELFARRWLMVHLRVADGDLRARVRGAGTEPLRLAMGPAAGMDATYPGRSLVAAIGSRCRGRSTACDSASTHLVRCESTA
jgi:hypothetical protein